MKTFTIDGNNQILVFASKKEAAATSATDAFTNQSELADLTADALLEFGDCLGIGRPAGFAVRRLELWDLHPLEQRVGSDADRLGSLIDVALRQQRGDGRFLLPPELCAVAFHSTQSISDCRKLPDPSPAIRQSRFPSESPCFSSR
jgi:hypothetical protein